MCGINGTIELTRSESARREIVAKMNHSLTNRGPDGSGAWNSETCQTTFGHTRLSVIDLSSYGSQPMISRCGRYAITFNGEIYNFQTIKQILIDKGIKFRSNSDTEVVLEGFAQLGIFSLLNMLNGMFAFALCDQQLKTVYLVRDRLGIKPLYYHHDSKHLVFSSQPKAIFNHPEFKKEMDPQALNQYFRYGYIPKEQSIYKNLIKLQPGTFLAINLENGIKVGSPIKYWDIEKVSKVKRNVTIKDAVEELNSVITESINLQKISDVPLGAFLSGGIDSSVVCSILQKNSVNKIKTFSIGFLEDRFDESRYARKIAELLGTDHTELILSPSDALKLIPALSDHYDEPFADASSIPTLLVSKLARQQVTVSLSGDGGDELFGGYKHYLTALALLNKLSKIPRQFYPLVKYFSQILTKLKIPNRLKGKLEKLSLVLPHPSANTVYDQVLHHWQPNEILELSGFDNQVYGNELKYGAALDCTGLEYFTLRDLNEYLVDDILVKLDRATMSFGLEGRVPLLDHKVVEYAASLPNEIRFLPNKGLLKFVLEKYLPKESFERPKSGFEIPLGQWLAGPMQEWAEDLLSLNTLKKYPFLKSEVIRSRFEGVKAANASDAYLIWDALMFISWAEKYQPSF